MARKVYLHRIYLNNGGYDAYGSYFGLGQRLYAYASEDGDSSGNVRAKDREDAKEQVRKYIPNATFYR